MKTFSTAGVLLATILASIVPATGHTAAFTSEEEGLWALNMREAPLTLSADGRWRLHVDARNVLHRVSLAGDAPEQTVVLPLAILTLSASRSGQRVAVMTSAGCVGLVEFEASPSATSKVSWEPDAQTPIDAAWPVDPNEDCKVYNSGLDRAIAISSDGRLLALRNEVIDLDSHRRVAALPVDFSANAGVRHALRMRFVDRDTKLLVVTATFGEGYESLDTPSDLQVAVWDIAKQSLLALASHESASLDAPQALFSDLSTQTNALTWIDADRYRASLASLKDGQAPAPLDVVQLYPGDCHARPVVRFQLAAYDLLAMVVDPLGRWIAGVRRIDLTKAATRGDPVEELVIQDIDSHRVISTTAYPHELHGLVATPDGTTIFGLAALADTPLSATPLPDDLLVAQKVDLARVSTPKAAVVQWNANACPVEDEAPDARVVSLKARLLRTVWTRQVENFSDIRARLSPPAGDDQSVPQAVAEDPPHEFSMRDGTLWLDQYATIAQLDPATGRTQRTLPTPRSQKVSSVAVPFADGFVNTQGDTLSWRPFDAGAANAHGLPARRVIDVRKGWTVQDVRPLARSVLAAWKADPGTPLKTDEQGTPVDLEVVLYDVATSAKLREFDEQSDAYAEVGAASSMLWMPEYLARCHDEVGALVSGYDWRVSYFDSFRATACGVSSSASTTRTVFWFGLDIAPMHYPISADGRRTRRTWATDGAVAVAQDDRVLRVFDVANRRELGQIAFAADENPQSVHVLADHGLVLVEIGGLSRLELRAYSFK